MDALAGRVLRGDRRALARAISLVEDATPEGRALLSSLYPKSGRAHIVGVTGPPGSGKSTLVDKLIAHHRAAGRRVAVVAVDPTSPFSGGALLGDRVRMQHRATDPGVFIRSMATRGALGGLAHATHSVLHVLDAAGFDVILVETVGVGQAEVDIVRAADTVVVVAVPGLGDEVQVAKAGLMEIADVFAVNKSDRPDSDRTAAELTAWLEMGGERAWRPPVLKTIAEKGDGVGDLAKACDDHLASLRHTGSLAHRRLDRARFEILDALRERLLDAATGGAGLLESAAASVAERKEDPATAAERIFGTWRS